jgi:hypothetical protein
MILCRWGKVLKSVIPRMDDDSSAASIDTYICESHRHPATSESSSSPDSSGSTYAEGLEHYTWPEHSGITRATNRLSHSLSSFLIPLALCHQCRETTQSWALSSTCRILKGLRSFTRDHMLRCAP